MSAIDLDDHTTRKSPQPPRPITAARALLAVVAVTHLVIPIVMVSRRADLQGEILQRHPSMTASTVDHSATVAINAAIGFHAVLLVLSLALIVRLPSMASRVLRLTVVSQLAGVAFSVVSWSSSSMFHDVIPVIDAIQIVIVACCAAAWPRRVRRTS